MGGNKYVEYGEEFSVFLLDKSELKFNSILRNRNTFGGILPKLVVQWTNPFFTLMMIPQVGIVQDMTPSTSSSLTLTTMIALQKGQKFIMTKKNLTGCLASL